jgi:hypothetical protein
MPERRWLVIVTRDPQGGETRSAAHLFETLGARSLCGVSRAGHRTDDAQNKKDTPCAKCSKLVRAGGSA